MGDLKIEGPLVQLEGEGDALKESYYDGYGDDEDNEDPTPFEETEEGSPFEDGEGEEGYTPFEEDDEEYYGDEDAAPFVEGEEIEEGEDEEGYLGYKSGQPLDRTTDCYTIHNSNIMYVYSITS